MYRLFVIASIALSLTTVSTAQAAGRLITLQEAQARGGTLQQQLMSELDKPEAKQKLAELGVTPDEARMRIAALSESEVQDLVKKGGAHHAGGDVVIGVTALLLIIIIILLLRR